ncbi:MAG: SOS response-associated peptidase [Dongiaceae bacterium]
MCGRYRSPTTLDSMRALLQFLNELPEDIRPRYNAAPTDSLPVVRLDRNGNRELAMLRWGLVPFWAKDAKVGAKFINARAETIATAPAFRTAFRTRRCLVPAGGFYEWKKAHGRRQPYHIGMRDGTPFAFAGLWERWNGGAALIESFTIITGEPNSLVADLHDRMPAILDPEDYDTWLRAADTAIAAAMLQQPFPAQLMAAYPVSTNVNSVKNDAPDLIEPIALNDDDRLI